MTLTKKYYFKELMCDSFYAIGPWGEQQAAAICPSVRLWLKCFRGWLGSRVVSMLDSGPKGHGFEWRPRRCRVTVLGKLFTPIMPLFTKQRHW